MTAKKPPKIPSGAAASGPGPAPVATRPDVTIYPTADAWIADVEPVEQTVSAERADELLAYSPAAFTIEPPAPSTETPPVDAGTTPQEA